MHRERPPMRSGLIRSFCPEDGVQFAHESVPEELLEGDEPRGGCARDGGRSDSPLGWRSAGCVTRTVHEIVREIGKHKPKDVLEQQALVADAEALVFVAPVFWMGFPAILKGWVERVFTYGFAYTLEPVKVGRGTWMDGSQCSPRRKV